MSLLLLRHTPGTTSSASCSFDHPGVFDREAARQRLLGPERGVEVPEDDATIRQRSASTRRVPPAHVVIIKGTPARVAAAGALGGGGAPQDS